MFFEICIAPLLVHLGARVLCDVPNLLISVSIWLCDNEIFDQSIAPYKVAHIVMQVKKTSRLTVFFFACCLFILFGKSFILEDAWFYFANARITLARRKNLFTSREEQSIYWSKQNHSLSSAWSRVHLQTIEQRWRMVECCLYDWVSTQGRANTRPYVPFNQQKE